MCGDKNKKLPIYFIKLFTIKYNVIKKISKVDNKEVVNINII